MLALCVFVADLGDVDVYIQRAPTIVRLVLFVSTPVCALHADCLILCLEDVYFVTTF